MVYFGLGLGSNFGYPIFIHKIIFLGISESGNLQAICPAVQRGKWTRLLKLAVRKGSFVLFSWPFMQWWLAGQRYIAMGDSCHPFSFFFFSVCVLATSVDYSSFADRCSSWIEFIKQKAQTIRRGSIKTSRRTLQSIMVIIIWDMPMISIGEGWTILPSNGKANQWLTQSECESCIFV